MFQPARPLDMWSRPHSCRATLYGSVKEVEIVPTRPMCFVRAASDYFPSRDVELLEYMELLAVFETSSRRLLPGAPREYVRVVSPRRSILRPGELSRRP